MRLGVLLALFVLVTSGLVLRQAYYWESLLLAPLWVWVLCGLDALLLVMVCLDMVRTLSGHAARREALTSVRNSLSRWRRVDPLGFFAAVSATVAFAMGVLGLPLLQLSFGSAGYGNPGPIGCHLLTLVGIGLLVLVAVLAAVAALILSRGTSKLSWMVLVGALVCAALFGPWFLDFF